MRSLWLAVSVAALVGCGSGGSSSSGGAAGAAATINSSTPTTTAGTTVRTSPPPGQWLKGDLHAHSAPHSQDADRQLGDTPGAVFQLGSYVGLDFMALTDHRTLDQMSDPTYLNPPLTVLNGCEWGGTVHINMVGLTGPLSQYSTDQSQGAATLNDQVQAVYDEVHAQGGAVILNHPCQDSKVHVWNSTDFDAVEVWNAYWMLPKGYKDASEQDVDDKLDGLGLTAEGIDAGPEIREAVRVRGGGANNQAIAFYEAHLNRGRHIAATGGSDRHSLTFPGLPTTRVFATDNTPAAICQGIREGRTWVGSFEGPEVEFTADANGDGVFESIIGDSVPLNQMVTYKVRVQNALDGRLEVRRDGQVIHAVDLQSADETFTFMEVCSQQSWVRVDVFERVDFTVPGGTSFQLLAVAGATAGGLSTVALPYGFQVSFGFTRIPQLRLPHEYDVILNMDLTRFGYARGAITSPIWAE